MSDPETSDPKPKKPRRPRGPKVKHPLPSLERLTHDLREASITLSDAEARFLVDAYYIIQEARKRSGNQDDSLVKSGEPHSLIAWLFTQNKMIEGELKYALDRYSETKPIGRWMKSIFAVGPVISAGLMAHIDINKAETVGDIWRFGGVDPTQKWLPKTKRPWNAELKTLIWKIGQTFMLFSGDERCYYGRLYKERKVKEEMENERGDNRELAIKVYMPKFEEKKKEAYHIYQSGKFPPAHIDAMARRWAAKLFLSHVHQVWRTMEGLLVPRPYILTRDHGHAHEIPPPNWPWIDPGPRWKI